MLLLLLLSLCVSPATVLKITPCHARSHKGLPEKELWDCWCNIFVGCIPFLSPTSVKVLKRQNNLNYVIWNYLFRLPGNLTVKPTVTKQLNYLNMNSLDSQLVITTRQWTNTVPITYILFWYTVHPASARAVPISASTVHVSSLGS